MPLQLKCQLSLGEGVVGQALIIADSALLEKEEAELQRPVEHYCMLREGSGGRRSSCCDPW